MNPIEDVEDWHAAMGLPVADQKFNDPTFRLRRARLIGEEIQETMDALHAGDAIEFLDGVCDSVWVLLGSLVELGWDFDGAWAEVVRSNFSKRGGVIDEHGLLRKPAHFSPPDLAPFVRRP